MKNTVVPLHKIIILAVFLCTALMTSLFVFRLSHPTIAVTLANDAGTLFPTPRDVKSFKLVATDQQAFTQKNFYQHWTLLFFGFTHCASVCPTTLDMLQRAYRKLKPIYPNLQVVLVSLDPNRDNLTALADYMHSFHPDFIGVTGNLPQLHKLQSQFGVYSAADATTNNYQIQHTSSIMLVNPRGEWTGLFNYGLNPEQFARAFTTAVKPDPQHV